MSWGIHEKHGLNELEIIEYRHDKLQDHLWRVEERHDEQLKALEAEVLRLKADLAAVVEQLKAHQREGK